MHESTVSRSVAGKLVQTANGQFSLRELFSSAIGRGGNGKTASAQAVKARITELVRNETAPNGVLSDDALVALLADEGLVMARRTVAKYRKSLNIPSSAQRRRSAKIARAAGA